MDRAKVIEDDMDLLMRREQEFNTAVGNEDAPRARSLHGAIERTRVRVRTRLVDAGMPAHLLAVHDSVVHQLRVVEEQMLKNLREMEEEG